MAIRAKRPDYVMSDDEVAELKRNAFGILSNRRRELMNRYPFVAHIAMGLELVPCRDSRMSTAATDGNSIFFDIEFLSTLTKDEQLFVFGHEVWHNVLQHSMRKENRDHQLFNIATDIEINQLLEADGFTMPKDGCTYKKYGLPAGLSAEEYYDLLVKNGSRPKYQPQSGGGSQGKDSKSGQQSSSNGVSGQFDDMIYDGETADDQSDKKSSDKYGKVGHDSDYQPKPSKEASERIRELAVAAAQMIERQRGNLPGHIAGVVKNLTEVEVSWQEMLQQHITKCLGDKRQWNPPNRRHVWHDSYLQSRRGQKLKIAVGIDTSGSTNPDLTKFLSELNSLVETFGNYELHMIQCDTKVQDYTLYDDSNRLDVENNGVEMHGGGGTELRPIFNYIADNELEVDAVVMFTDGYCEEFTDTNGLSTLWVISHCGTNERIKCGDVVMLKS